MNVISTESQINIEFGDQVVLLTVDSTVWCGGCCYIDLYGNLDKIQSSNPPEP
jgi:hypothetical protein